MTRTQFAPGAALTGLPGEKFKRCKVAIHLTVPSTRAEATSQALLPHVLDRRCAAIPDPLALSRRLLSLYGAELTSESYVAGTSRVLTFGISGLKNEYALAGEDLAAGYLDLLCNLLFAPKLAGEAFEAEDVAIEKEKQADFLRSELNDKRGYCIRQARRRLYGDNPLGIESPGYLEDLPAITPQSLYQVYREVLRTAQVEVMVCGAAAEPAAAQVAKWLEKARRAPGPMAGRAPLPAAAPQMAEYSEAMDTVQGKLAILCTSGRRDDARGEVVMRMASALYGGLPTSRLFMNVREKQSLCYYCASSYSFFSGTLMMDSGVDHQNAAKAAEAILHELAQLQKAPVTADELTAAKLYLRNAFSHAKDSPDALMHWAFSEWLRGTARGLDEVMAEVETVTAEEIRAALAAYTPALEYRLVQKEAGQ